MDVSTRTYDKNVGFSDQRSWVMGFRVQGFRVYGFRGLRILGLEIHLCVCCYALEDPKGPKDPIIRYLDLG